MTELNRSLPRLSLLQLAKLIVFSAVAFACIAPGIHLTEAGVATVGAILMLEAVAVPLVIAALGFVLLKRSPWKDGFICFSLLCSVVSALGVALWLFWYMMSLFTRRVTSLNLADLRQFSLTALVILVLSFAMAFLVIRLWKAHRARPRASAAVSSQL